MAAVIYGKAESNAKRVEELIEDAAYLQKEAEALKYVINDVPYEANPPEGYSIKELLMLIDHAQSNYYEPVFNEALNSSQPVRLNNHDNFKSTFDPSEKEKQNIEALLTTLASHRASFVSTLEETSLINWETKLYKNDKEILLADLIEEMNHNDQIHLKKITNLVQSYHQQKKTQREIKQRQGPQTQQNGEE